MRPSRSQTTRIAELPAYVSTYLEPRYLASIRAGTATFTGSSAFGVGGGFGGGFAEGFAAGAAGGGDRTITVIRQ